jgi:G:T-mismatch repair DNA endonuclease (very short patch repair protein)
VRRELEEGGWKVVTVWECETHVTKTLDNHLRCLMQAQGQRR